MTRLLPPTPATIARAAAVVDGGGLVCFPTDTLYAVACRADQGAARRRFYAAKARDPGQPAIVMASSTASLAPWVELGPVATAIMAEHWPGPLTLVLPATIAAVEALGQVVTARSLAVRIPDHATASELLTMVGGPLATSSANVSGAAPPRSGEEAQVSMKDRVEVVIDGDCPLGMASSILDLTGSKPRVIREGAIPAARLLS